MKVVVVTSTTNVTKQLLEKKWYDPKSHKEECEKVEESKGVTRDCHVVIENKKGVKAKERSIEMIEDISRARERVRLCGAAVGN